MVNDEGNGSDGPYTHRSLMKEDDVGSMENRIAVFSSPQNRRTSSARKLKTKTLSGSSAPMGVPRDSGTLGDGGGVVGGGGGDNTVSVVSRVGVNGPTIGSVPREALSAGSPGAVGVSANASTVGAVGRGTGDASFESWNAFVTTPTRVSKANLLNRSQRGSTGRVQEVLGSLPILLVDDSVSILKMTKRAILNECANIRSTILLSTN